MAVKKQLKHLSVLAAWAMAGALWGPGVQAASFPSPLGPAGESLDPQQLLSFEPAHIQEILPTRNEDPDFPASLQGIWWLKDTPGLFEAVSLANSRWDEQEKTLYLKTYGASTYVINDREDLEAVLSPMFDYLVTYKIVFDEAVQKGQLILTMSYTLLGLVWSVEIPKGLLDFQMTWTRDGVWTRQTRFFGMGVDDYELTRIVQEDGTPDQAFSDFLEEVKTPELLVIQ